MNNSRFSRALNKEFQSVLIEAYKKYRERCIPTISTMTPYTPSPARLFERRIGVLDYIGMTTGYTDELMKLIEFEYKEREMVLSIL